MFNILKTAFRLPGVAMHTSDTEAKPIPDVQADLRSLGETVRQRRLELQLSVQDLARRSDISAGLISQIERGLANPAFGTISKLASALGLQMGVFFEEKPAAGPNPVVRRNERRRLAVPDRNFLYELLTPDLDHTLEFVWVESAPNSSTEGSPFVHKGEECGLVLQGTLEVHVGLECYVLHSGDSIIINSSIPHWYFNPGPERVLSVWAITPPTF
jgi:transcriptional regulator with XRE-family HTH domain